MPRFIYSFILTIVMPFVPLKLLWRGFKQHEYRQHWAERVGFYNTIVQKPIIWLHCVSVGETRAAEPLIKALQVRYPQHQILLTHGTPTGRDASEALFGDSIQRVYLPYDLPCAVNNFLTHFQPKIGLIMETELWFNLIAACKQNQIPLLLLNARMSEKSFVGYQKLGKLTREGLQNLTAVAAQTITDATRLQHLGAQNISVAGNLKFDVKPPADIANKGAQLRTLLGENRTLFLAASTRAGEEALILKAVEGLDVLTIIVPRHPQRFDEVEALIKKAGFTYLRRSNLRDPAHKNVQVILGDSMGELFSYYAACDFTFIGGSLMPFGGQNLIEAATMGKPILIGEHTFNFADATEKAINAGAAIRVKDVKELRQQIQFLTENKDQCKVLQQAALSFSASATGATKRLMLLIESYLF
ncbi:MAG: lipid IV(A) 3-deoxy-D-manno-octulosonic acid transferase [Bdellovibrio sp.]|nr:lipid IV(A) 3-deoxy-D-manno-octulosonic acid transferase [Methylotenera sp.]